MSFGTYARKARDPSLPYGRRINALAGCVQRYQPVGYQATFAYLEHVAGHFSRDEAALLRAMDMLSSSRDLWLLDLGDYARRRKEAKRVGQRSPGATEFDPTSPTCWYGDQRNAALFALGYLLRRMAKDRQVRADAADAEVLLLASGCVGSGGHLGYVERDRLDRIRLQFERLRDVAGWPDFDGPSWRRAHDSLWILRLIEDASLSGDAGRTG
ncbi:hypothetical protein AB0M36_12760 [Actinoplanes sp. NPDC051346]|uniref:hypothetical protein n=1 Tax=Actinoplanes sp. NPDC051346 TaxID=3155048 RepID=UPI0034175F3A